MEPRVGFVRTLWRLAAPYFRSEDRWPARGLLAVIVALNLALVFITVLVNQWNNAFYNALQDRDIDEFWHQLMIFCGLATAFILIAVYQLYLNQMLQIRWRRWLTDRFLAAWLGPDRAYYRLSAIEQLADNPDQRIAEDVRLFVTDTLTLSLGLLSAVVTLISFIGILWSLSGPLTVSGIAIPGYMVWVALIYALFGTWLTHRIGRPLIRLNFDQQRYEADFRFALVRLRENAESIALYGGEAREYAGLRERFAAIYLNWWSIMKRQKQLTWFTAGYEQLATVFPIVVAAPRYFSGAMQLGGLMQTASAFGRVQGAMSWFVEAYTRLADWRATVDRLSSFAAALEPHAPAVPTLVRRRGGDRLELEDLTLTLPDGRPLARPVTLSLERGERLLILGPSGSGKSTLLRAIAGLWPFGQGEISLPAGARVLFLPQRPYLPLGSLREIVCYPGDPAALSDAAIKAALADCRLAHIAGRLDEVQPWSQVLSPGEQQRLGIARTLLYRPDWCFLDEATSALDEATEEHLYRLLDERLAQAALVSVAHRSTVERFHERRLVLDPLPRADAPPLASGSAQAQSLPA